jgi:acyl-CoA thioesterase I
LIKQAQKVTGASDTLILAPSMPDLTNPEMAAAYSLEKLDEYVDIAQRDAGKTNSFFFDLTHKMEKLKDLPSFMIADGLHYSEKGISWLADVLADQINKMA